jgi:hypothetical protein
MNPSNLNAGEIKHRVSLVGLLSALGHEPAKSTGRELVYINMLRDTGKKPAFFVNKELNVWYDRDAAIGGNVIDFAMAYWKLTFIGALSKIAAMEGIELGEVAIEKRVRKHARRLPHYRVEEIKPLGTNPLITEFLNGCGIARAAKDRLHEIYYYVEDEQKNRKQFFAAGWQNELSFWEVRNIFFKGCLGHKAITFIAGDQSRLMVFDNYFNYLSWLEENPLACESVLVLNNMDLLQSAIRKAKDFLEISVCFNRDYSGRLACAEFVRVLPWAVDGSVHYKDYKDYNEMVVSRSKCRRPLSKGV